MNTEFIVPSFGNRNTYDFGSTNDTFEVYKELNAIAEEIEECRLRNC